MSQVAPWVLLTAAGISAAAALLGALSGLYISGRREDSRDKQRNSREDKFRNHADRKLAYEKLIIALINWQLAAQEVTAANPNQLTSKRSKLDQRLAEFMRLRGAVWLLAPLEVRTSLGVAANDIARVTTDLDAGIAILPNAVGAVVSQPLEAMRSDLGIESLTTGAGIIASPEIQEMRRELLTAIETMADSVKKVLK